MEALISVVAVVWSILCIILFFKIWRMCNNISAIRSILSKEYECRSGISKDADKSNNQQSKSENDLSTSPISKGFAIYKPENMKVEIIGKGSGENVYKCKSLNDGQVYYFVKDVLEFIQ